MKIYILKSNPNRYNALCPAVELDWETRRSFDGRSKADGWIPIKMKKEYIKKNLILPNYIPYFCGEFPIIDREGKDVLHDLIEGNAEFLPLEYDERDCYALNITRFINCLDRNKGNFKIRDDGRISWVYEYAFYEEKIGDIGIFKINDYPCSSIFVTDKFRDRVIENNLTGFCFELVWDGGKKVEKSKSTYGDNVVDGEHYAVEMISDNDFYDTNELLNVVVDALKNFTAAHGGNNFYELGFVCHMQYDKPTMFLCLNTLDNPATSPCVYKYFGIADITLSENEADEDTIERLRVSTADMIKKFREKYITPKFPEPNDFIVEYSDYDEDLTYMIG